jgi:monoterpene epsilon-lactone hydrolase
MLHSNLSTAPRAHAGFTEIRRKLSEAERQIEQTILAATSRHFATFVGSRRETYDAMPPRTPIAEGVTLEAVDRDGVKGWWVRPADAPADRAIIFVHGGAYMLGSAQAYRGLVSQIAVRTGIATFAMDYPLAPEHPFPAAYDATIAAKRWLKTQGIAQVALMGDSAGGALALAAMGEAEANSPRVAAVALFSPWTDLALSGASFTSPDTYDPVFQPQVLAGAAATYLGTAEPRDGRASPLYAIPDNVPPLLIQVGADELLLDDSRRYAASAAAKGGVVQLEIYEGLHHVFQRSAAELPSAGFALDSVAEFLRNHWTTE